MCSVGPIAHLLFEHRWMMTKANGAPSKQYVSTSSIFFYLIPRECLRKSFGMTYQRLGQNKPNHPRQFIRIFQSAAGVPSVGNFSLKWRVGSGITAPVAATKSLEYGICSVFYICLMIIIIIIIIIMIIVKEMKLTYITSKRIIRWSQTSTFACIWIIALNRS